VASFNLYPKKVGGHNTRRPYTSKCMGACPPVHPWSQ